jgi:hypothetical protein
MARDGNRQGGNKVRGKIRFIMLEADIEDGNLTEIAQAISNAVRAAPVQVIQAPATPRAIEGRVDGKSLSAAQATPPVTVFDDDDSDSDNGAAETPLPASKRQPREQSPRTYTQPKPINGLNWNGDGVSFKEFATGKKQTSFVKRYLVIAAWFRLHNDLPSITLEHVFTAYGMMGWGWETGKDMAIHFREGMRPERRWYESDSKGNYTITDLGLNVVENMETDKESS